ncbi:MAG TPA: hypothetical protein VNS09_17700 [Solirubrobacter sp.]|nr:hypothetical protein [Solirubrobacter sp.]
MRGLALGCIAAAVCVAAITLGYRSAYWSFPWNGGPDRVKWCERTYLRHGSEPLSPSGPVAAILRAPPLVGDRFYVTTPARCRDVAPTLLYRDVGEGRYEAYALSGGP